MYNSSLNLDSAVLSEYRYYNENAVKHYANVIRCDILEKFYSLEEFPWPPWASYLLNHINDSFESVTILLTSVINGSFSKVSNKKKK